MQPMVTIENVSKRYRLGGLHPGYLTFRALLEGVVRAPFRRRDDDGDGDACAVERPRKE